MIGIKSIASYVPVDGIDNYAQGAKFAKDEEFIIGNSRLFYCAEACAGPRFYSAKR